MSLAALPEYDFLPSPLWLITILHLLTLALHFVAMNVLVGGIAVVLLGKFDDRWRHPTVRKFLKLFPTLMAATVSLGVAPLLFVQLAYGSQIYSASIVSAWFWICIPVAVMVAYYFLYGAAFAKESNPRIGTWLVLALIGLTYVSVVYSSVFSMAERPELQQGLYAANQSGTALSSNIGEWIFRWLHMLSGALMVGSFLVAWLGKDDAQASKAGRTFFLYGLIVASVTGTIYLLALGDHLKPFMQSTGIYFVTAGALLTLGALHFLWKKRFVAAGLMVFVSLATMVVARHVLRLVVLPEALHPAAIYEGKVNPQWDVFAIFLVCFVIALALVAWMLKLFFTDRAAEA